MRSLKVILILLIVVGLVGVVGWMGYRGASGAPSARMPTAGPEVKTVAVERGDVSQLLIVPGEIVPVQQRDVSFPVGGRLTDVTVLPGDSVTAGQALARLETGPLEEAVAQAEADLQVKQAALAALEGGPDPATVAKARQDVVQAQAAVDMNRESKAVAVETARLNWERSANAVREAQDDYSRIYWQNAALRLKGVDLAQDQIDAETSAWRDVENAQAAMEQARLAYDLALKEQGTSATTAQSQLNQAQAQLDSLAAEPDQQEMIQAQTDVHAAEVALQKARDNLAAAALLAPFDGTVLDVMAQSGDRIQAEAVLIELANLEEMEVLATVAQEEVIAVRPGQSVQLAFDALPGESYTGQVARIVPKNVSSQLVKYEVYISMDETPTGLLPGMTADVEITTAERQDVLVLPRRSVHAQENSAVPVPVLESGQVVTYTVEIGLVGDLNVEVLSGLQEGDQVVVKR